MGLFRSGHLASAEIDRLVATARLMVFPIVRASSLWAEIAGL